MRLPIALEQVPPLLTIFSDYRHGKNFGRLRRDPARLWIILRWAFNIYRKDAPCIATFHLVVPFFLFLVGLTGAHLLLMLVFPCAIRKRVSSHAKRYVSRPLA